MPMSGAERQCAIGSVMAMTWRTTHATCALAAAAERAITAMLSGTALERYHAAGYEDDQSLRRSRGSPRKSPG
jgi:hypothetical protein